ncbi:hypothetical protein AB6A23_05595 [Paenibacillus tarimensis]
MNYPELVRGNAFHLDKGFIEVAYTGVDYKSNSALRPLFKDKWKMGVLLHHRKQPNDSGFSEPLNTVIRLEVLQTSQYAESLMCV